MKIDNIATEEALRTAYPVSTFVAGTKFGFKLGRTYNERDYKAVSKALHRQYPGSADDVFAALGMVPNENRA